eukprot:CAMPEP_0185768806 /NCGR_PEP_ID=MMETSP1174-20130828/52270_1 /TAXON_ID=35687 /ORGANISM="Dictyocha speculum, Strain CCMP1381" /LENGTH=475 /DNA_ID=CAMNT_0028453665 /DNA_START=29 /DNA_END=1456 /DNA_ORIENTATION=+
MGNLQSLNLAKECCMATPETVVVIDPASTGALVSLGAQQRGANVIAVWSDACGGIMKTHAPVVAKGIVYAATFDENGQSPIALAASIKKTGLSIVTILAGSETGVRLADSLADAFGLRGNGGATSDRRRNKHAQQEAVRNAGYRAVRQAHCTSLGDVVKFLDAESEATNGQPVDVVLKPVESAGSDGVARCQSRDEAKEHFNKLMGAINQCGDVNDGVLAQECLKGIEYVVDQVSRDGIHKTTCVWQYEKRIVNGVTAPIVYFGMEIIDPQSERARALISYMRIVLDCIGLREGPSHGEIIWNETTGPCLVEMNCRAHGSNGTWVSCATAALGSTQVDFALDWALNNGQAWATRPDRPPRILTQTRFIMLVSYFEGIIEACPGYDKIKALPSYSESELHLGVGDALVQSVDCCSVAGMVTLVHKDKAVVDADYAFIRALENVPGALFQVHEVKKKNSVANFQLLVKTGGSVSFKE